MRETSGAPVEIAEALTALQLGWNTTWEEVRASYRRLLRVHHPDLTGEPGAADRTARLTAAYAVLVEATDGGRRPLARPQPPSAPRRPSRPSPRRPSRPSPRQARPSPRPARPAAAGRPPQSGPGATGVSRASGAVADRRSPEEVFGRLRAAAPSVGVVSGVDPESLTLQILVEAPGAAASQLLAEVGRREGETTIMFTLESLTSAPGPPIEAVVKQLLARL